MAERQEGTAPQESSRGKYFDKTQEFFQVFNTLNGAINRARNDKDSKTFLRFTMLKTRTANDFAWMETSRESGMPADHFLPLLSEKQEMKRKHTEHATFNSIMGIKPETNIKEEVPLGKKYIEIGQELNALNKGIEQAISNENSKSYLSLIRAREETISDFEWMETFREAGIPHDKIVTLYTEKEERKKAAERAAFDEIIKNSEKSKK